MPAPRMPQGRESNRDQVSVTGCKGRKEAGHPALTGVKGFVISYGVTFETLLSDLESEDQEK